MDAQDVNVFLVVPIIVRMDMHMLLESVLILLLLIANVNVLKKIAQHALENINMINLDVKLVIVFLFIMVVLK